MKIKYKQKTTERDNETNKQTSKEKQAGKRMNRQNKQNIHTQYNFSSGQNDRKAQGFI